MQHFLKFQGGLLDGAGFEIPIAVDKVQFVGENNVIHRYEVKEKTKSSKVTVYKMIETRNPDDYDEEIFDIIKNESKVRAKKQETPPESS